MKGLLWSLELWGFFGLFCFVLKFCFFPHSLNKICSILNSSWSLLRNMEGNKQNAELLEHSKELNLRGFLFFPHGGGYSNGALYRCLSLPREKKCRLLDHEFLLICIWMPLLSKAVVLNCHLFKLVQTEEIVLEI